jgi:hypothetical protein
MGKVTERKETPDGLRTALDFLTRHHVQNDPESHQVLFYQQVAKSANPAVPRFCDFGPAVKLPVRTMCPAKRQTAKLG